MQPETIVAGFVIGLLVGLTGIGGGVLMTPYLLLVLHLHPVTAVGTDMVFAFVAKTAGAIQHRRQRTLWLKPAFYIAIGSIPASLVTSLVVVKHVQEKALTEEILPRILGGLLVLAAILVATRALGFIQGGKDSTEHWPNWRQSIILGLALGIVVGATSVGSGTLFITVMLLCFSLPPDHLIGLNVTTGALLAFFPSLTYAYHGFVAWRILISALIGALPGAVIGSHLVTTVPTKAIRLILSFLVLLAGIRLLA